MTAAEPGALSRRVGALFFLQFVVWSGWFVPIGSWAGLTLRFTGTQIAAIYGVYALAGVVAPMAVSTLRVRTERLLAALFALGGALLLLISLQQQVWSLLGLVFLYSLTFTPTLGLVPALALRHLPDPAGGFARARAMGTVGWITAGLVVGGLRLERTALPLRGAALLSVALAVFALTLPATPPAPRAERPTLAQALGLHALGVARDPVVALFLVAGVVIGIPSQLYNAFAAIQLAELGAPRPAALLTLGQGTEVLVLLLLPRWRAALGLRGTLALGIGAWLLRSLLFAVVAPSQHGLLVTAVLLHGVAFTCVYVAGNLMVHERVAAPLRTAAQGLWTMVGMGLGNLVGALVAGRTVDAHLRPDGSHDWSGIWLVPAAAAAAMLVLSAAAWWRSPRPPAVATPTP